MGGVFPYLRGGQRAVCSGAREEGKREQRVKERVGPVSRERVVSGWEGGGRMGARCGKNARDTGGVFVQVAEMNRGMDYTHWL